MKYRFPCCEHCLEDVEGHDTWPLIDDWHEIPCNGAPRACRDAQAPIPEGEHGPVFVAKRADR